MSADVLQTIKIRAGDLECSVCIERFSLTNRLPMSLLCGHTFCSYCLTQIKKCPTCRKEIKENPQKNTMVCSIIETHSSTSSISLIKTCSLHLQPCDVLSPITGDFVCAQCFFENNNIIPTLKSINAKSQKVKQEGEQINRKRKSAIDSFEEFLLRGKNIVEQTVLDGCDEELAQAAFVKKKQKKDIEAFYYSEKERFQHEILAADLVRYFENNQIKLEKWEKYQDSKAAAGIMDIDFKADKKMEDFDKKVSELKIATQTREKSFLEMLKSQVDPKDLIKEDEWSDLCRKFQEYGFIADYQRAKSDQCGVISLKEGYQQDFLELNPKDFNCELPILKLTYFNQKHFMFRNVCDLLGNFASLTVLCINFTIPPFFELMELSNLIPRLKLNLRSLTLNFPLEKATRGHLENFMQRVLNFRRVSKIDLSSKNEFTLTMSFEPEKCFLKLFNVSIPEGLSKLAKKSFEALSILMGSVRFGKLQFHMGAFSFDPQDFKFFERFLRNFQYTENLQMNLEDPLLLKTNFLTCFIFKGKKKPKDFKTLELVLPGNDLLCSQFEGMNYCNRFLKELSLTLSNFKMVDLQKMFIFIRCFRKLKVLKLRFYNSNKDLALISEFFKKISHLNRLRSFSFEFFTLNEPASTQLQKLKALLPSSLTQSTIAFEKPPLET